MSHLRKYAQCWRKPVARDQPPILDKDLIDMFMATLEVQYLEKMVQSAFSSFFDIVTAGERIKSHIKKGKLPNIAKASRGAKKPYSIFNKKNDRE